MNDTPTLSTSSEAAVPATWRDYLELTKPRLSFLSVTTAGIGYLAVQRSGGFPHFAATMTGTALAAAGVAALNQWMESDTDALMRRTRTRPIPTGKIPTGTAFVMGTLLCMASLALLFAAVNPLAALLALATIVSYLGIYTPAKRWSRFSTELGAVAGALPPLIGWAAAEGRVSTLGWLLFGVLFFWQIPHFMAIAWFHRRDYEAVSFPMLPVRDERGTLTAVWSLVNTLALVAVSVAPTLLGFASWAYGAAALLCGAWFTYRAVCFLQREHREQTARKLFFASLAYLPAILGALVLDRWLIA